MKIYNEDEAWRELIECYRKDDFQWAWYKDSRFWIVIAVLGTILLIINYYK